MKIIIADVNTFERNKQLFVKSIQKFHPETTEERMWTTINNRSFYCFSFDENNEVTAWCRVAKPWFRKTIYVIRQVETDEKYRCQGYASACYQAVEKYISQIDSARKIVAFVDDENIKSIKFHKKAGFSKSKKASKYLSNKYGWESAIMFEKEINKKHIKETNNENFEKC